MKQSLARITAWAKKHPWLAALIVGAVILLGYLVYKRSAAGGGGGGGGGEEAESFAEMPQGSADVSAIPGMSDIPSPVNSGGGSSTSSSDLGTSSTTGQASPASFPQFEPIPPASAGQFGSGWVAPDLGETVSASFAPTPAVESGGGVPTARTAQAIQTGVFSATGKPVKAPTPDKKKEPLKKTASAIQTGYFSNTGKPVKGPAVTSAAKLGTAGGQKKSVVATKGRTPAERLGLYWLFTGVYNNMRYAGGFPVGPAVTPGATAGKKGSSKKGR